MSDHDCKGPLLSSRDDELARAWREVSDEQPPSQLDAAIIAIARKSLPMQESTPNAPPVRARYWHRLLQWQPLVAAATVAGLALILAQRVPRDATDYGQGSSAEKSVTRPERIYVPDGAPRHGAVPAAPTAPASPPMAAAENAQDTAGTADAAELSGENSVALREVVEPEVADRAAVAAAAEVPSSAARQQGLPKASATDTEARAAKIAALHESGDVTAAAGELRALRAADPDAEAYLPHSLRDWARTVE